MKASDRGAKRPGAIERCKAVALVASGIRAKPARCKATGRNVVRGLRAPQPIRANAHNLVILMAWTQGDIDVLKQAMATGVRRAVFGSGETRREQEFQSLTDMLRLLAEMEGEVAGINAPSRTAVTQFTRD